MTLIADPNCQDEFEAGSISSDDARRRILQAVAPLAGHERLHLRAALGRVLAADVRSPLAVPGHTNSAMDGYALNAASLPSDDSAVLSVTGASFAGHPYAGVVARGECVRIMTGAVMPDGADTVVPQEQVETLSGQRIRIDDRHRPGQNVRQAGEDLRPDEVVVQQGQRLAPSDLGLLASLGVAELDVYRRPRVAFFSTGDELRSIGEPLAPGEIFDSNRYTLYGMLQQLGAEPVDLGVVADTPDATREAFRLAAADADVVLTSGGVSVGEADYIKDSVAALGGIEFSKVAMKPGRPLSFGRVDKALFFGLPGNPVSVMVTFYLFVQPALRRLAGETNTEPLRLWARCEQAPRNRPGRTEYQRGVLAANRDGELTVSGTGPQGSGILSSMSRANCFMVLEPDAGKLSAGDRVPVIPFSELR